MQRVGSEGLTIYIFVFCSRSKKNAIGNLIRSALNLQIALGSIDILTILILPIQVHGISFHLSVSSSFSLISILQCSEYSFLPSYIALFLGILFFLMRW